jgi:hypothetical protein
MLRVRDRKEGLLRGVGIASPSVSGWPSVLVCSFSSDSLRDFFRRLSIADAIGGDVPSCKVEIS